MELIDDRAYLEPPDNEAKAVLKCFFCEEDIYEGQDYYVLNGFNCCEECLDVHFKWREASARMGDHRTEVSVATAEVTDHEAENADVEYHDLKE